MCVGKETIQVCVSHSLHTLIRQRTDATLLLTRTQSLQRSLEDATNPCLSAFSSTKDRFASTAAYRASTFASVVKEPYSYPPPLTYLSCLKALERPVPTLRCCDTTQLELLNCNSLRAQLPNPSVQERIAPRSGRFRSRISKCRRRRTSARPHALRKRKRRSLPCSRVCPASTRARITIPSKQRRTRRCLCARIVRTGSVARCCRPRHGSSLRPFQVRANSFEHFHAHSVFVVGSAASQQAMYRAERYVSSKELRLVNDSPDRFYDISPSCKVR